ncbi:hypothetical protein KAFR_0A06910 [Kazachstania africana CBS 2517]|uniref:Ubiquitin carboxyl-terminal hydrolase n=1 Tax=Kazachstania africana (strain ATCC 22294 / BCRC 22015 / CBS 2517 / CECT 1963 / NBRC 1671 / NRRL Y-8276) TaxID=1071382 RepID=H2AP26_KAZAF|nr:hypothetical protein KAFR_0A06910 [Kazachstania africana CBS 2517]CCF56126.1 hypothetical protein KAFR_0A06910 [Kazachstania africana CBS 2517]
MSYSPSEFFGVFVITLFILKLSYPFTKRMYNNNNFFSRKMYNNAINDKKFIKRGGYIAGLVNDGNTCFMNSVLQSLASSKELAAFLDNVIENGSENNGDIKFTETLRELLLILNKKYYKEKPYFKTNKLLKTMSNGPNKNIILGYDQEDAQEFFQQILSDLEKNIKKPSTEKKEERNNIKESDLPDDALLGQDDLNNVGTVYIPTEQIEPNSVLENPDQKLYSPFKLITPLDGITAERIGCLTCGENGGIRYSVFSGLSLNLPSESLNQSTLKLSELLNEWVKPEIIEGVECNRCSLNAVRSHLQDQIQNDTIPEKLKIAINQRLNLLTEILSKPVIEEDDYKKYHTENMVRKCSKSKQILISRPPPFLSIHINRSVFDPRTYMIRKNNARVLFKTRLNLQKWACNVDEINLDARLPMSKNEHIVQNEESSEDENIGGDYYAKLHHRFEQEYEDSEDEENEIDSDDDRDVRNYDPLNGEEMNLSSEFSSSEDEQEEEEVDALGNTIRNMPVRLANEVEQPVPMSNSSSEEDQEPAQDSESESELNEDVEQKNDEISIPPTNGSMTYSSSVPAGPLIYSLRSVIVHYGTHNYGHYIAFRKYRGYWWRISDETVYIVDETEVLSTPGVFMLFYEYDYDSVTGRMKDDLESLDQEDESEIEIVQDEKVKEEEEEEEEEEED